MVNRYVSVMLRALIILIISTLFFSALFTPLAYELVSLAVGNIWPFSRVFDRVAMVVCAVGIYLLRDSFKLEALREAWALDSGRKIKRIVLGVGLSLLGSLLVLAYLIDGDPLAWKVQDQGVLLWKIAKVIPAALLISLIEESFFRVLLFQNLRRGFSVAMAICITSLVYALAHFIVPYRDYVYLGFSFEVGFEYLGHVGRRMATLNDLPAFIGLFIVGATLCQIISRTRSLALCIGLHTGWIIALKFSLYVTETTPNFDFGSGVGRRYFLVADPLSWIMVLSVGAIALYLNTRESKGTR